jgi:hypothetical protein
MSAARELFGLSLLRAFALASSIWVVFVIPFIADWVSAFLHQFVHAKVRRIIKIVGSIHDNKHGDSRTLHVQKLRKKLRSDQKVLTAMIDGAALGRLARILDDASEDKTLVAFIETLIDFIDATKWSDHHLLERHEVHDSAYASLTSRPIESRLLVSSGTTHIASQLTRERYLLDLC